MREKWQQALSSPIHARAERSLVALTPFGDLFAYAKDLLVEANAFSAANYLCVVPEFRRSSAAAASSRAGHRQRGSLVVRSGTEKCASLPPTATPTNRVGST